MRKICLSSIPDRSLKS